jgi:UDP-2-acetamido-2,6-beta-L-arabino-hexul-4-ose reductase
MKVLVTGANGFLGRNLVKFLSETPGVSVLTYTRGNDLKTLFDKLIESNFIFHLAGVSRPKNEDEFISSNVNLTLDIVNFLKKNRITTPIYFSSSIFSNKPSNYGISKIRCEKLLNDLAKTNGNLVTIDRLVRIFGPGAKPFYNSVIATFCYVVAHNKNLEFIDQDRIIEIAFIDDWLNYCKDNFININYSYKLSSYVISLKELYSILVYFKNNEKNFSYSINKDLLNYLYTTYKYYEGLNSDAFPGV